MDQNQETTFPAGELGEMYKKWLSKNPGGDYTQFLEERVAYKKLKQAKEKDFVKTFAPLEQTNTFELGMLSLPPERGCAH